MSTKVLNSELKSNRQNNASLTDAEEKNGAGKSVVAGVVSGAAGIVAGAATGVGARIAYEHFTAEEQPLADAEEVVVEQEPEVVEVQPEVAEVQPEVVEPQPVVAEPQPVAQEVVEPIAPEVDANEVAENIISGEAIDEVDAAQADFPFVVDGMQEVYTVDGELQMQAYVTDGEGNDMVLVDVNGDNIFDAAVDTDGSLIAEIGGVSASDIELMYAQQHLDTPEYIESGNDVALNDNSFEQDIIDLG
ncbi:MAG: hypothetical protein SPK24_03670 [Candidatus Limisoma sp.]|nr:hypothetical protein [Candidatus Limisoma sp.]